MSVSDPPTDIGGYLVLAHERRRREAEVAAFRNADTAINLLSKALAEVVRDYTDDDLDMLPLAVRRAELTAIRAAAAVEKLLASELLDRTGELTDRESERLERRGLVDLRVAVAPLDDAPVDTDDGPRTRDMSGHLGELARLLGILGRRLAISHEGTPSVVGPEMETPDVPTSTIGDTPDIQPFGDAGKSAGARAADPHGSLAAPALAEGSAGVINAADSIEQQARLRAVNQLRHAAVADRAEEILHSVQALGGVPLQRLQQRDDAVEFLGELLAVHEGSPYVAGSERAISDVPASTVTETPDISSLRDAGEGESAVSGAADSPTHITAPSEGGENA